MSKESSFGLWLRLLVTAAFLYAASSKADCDTQCQRNAQAIRDHFGYATKGSPHELEYNGAKRLIRDSNARFWTDPSQRQYIDPLPPDTVLERYYSTDESWAKRELARSPRWEDDRD